MSPISSASVSVNAPDKTSSSGLQDLSTLTVEQLRRLSADIGIKIKSRAKKKDIIQSLLDYEKNGTSTTSPPTNSQLLRRPHKGPRIRSGPAKRETLSARRARNLRMMGSNTPSGLKVNLMSPLEWSKKIILKAEGSIGDCPGDLETQKSHPMESRTTQIIHAQANEVVQGPTTAREGSAPVATTPTSSPYSHSTGLTPRSGQWISPGSNVTVLLENSKTPLIKDDPYAISLGAGVQLQYGEADLYEPGSLVGLISDPDFLYSMWDDTSSAWKCESPLVIRHVPVAIKYWRDFYGNFKHQKVWDSIKQNWHSFRILMQEYQGLGKDGFRSKWSTNGQLTPSLRIIALLRCSSRDKDEKLVTAAKRNFTEQQFNNLFSYKSKNGMRVLRSPSAIAKRYRKLAQPWSSTHQIQAAPDAPRTPPCSS